MTPEQLADAAGRSALFKIPELWRRRFGRELKSRAELISWLCVQLDREAADVEAMPLGDVAKVLAPAEDSLGDIDRQILDSMPTGEPRSAREIAKLAGLGLDSVKHRLRPEYPLRAGGYIIKPDGSHGYIRRA